MILVTGGAGFIGSVLARELNKIGEQDLWIVDRLRCGNKWLNLRNSKFVEFTHVDKIFDNLSLFRNVKAIFHIGACSTTTEKNADYFMDNNFEFSKKLFKVAAEQNIPFIYASSAATYGDGKLGYVDDVDTIQKLLPLNPYGYSKQLFDEWVLRETNRPELWFGLKFFNVYGPNEYHKGGQASVVYHAFNQIKDSGKIKLFKSCRDGFAHGDQKRDFIYVVDVVKAMIKLYQESDKTKSSILNLGTGKAATFNDLAKAVFLALNLKENIEYIDMPEGLDRQYQYYTQADMSKFYKVVSGINFSSIAEGTTDYIRNFLVNKNQYY